MRVTFECFVRMLRENDREACYRVLDAMMLEKIKQLESVDYYPDAPADIRPSREVWEKKKARIVERYPSAEIRAMRRHGFTGISIETRCRQVGELSAYNTIYRNFSRNVHSTDYVEQFGDDLQGSDFPDYLDARNSIMFGVTYNCVKWVAEWVNNLLERPVDLKS